MSDLLLKAVSGQKIDVKSTLHHNGEVSFNHVNDSYLSQLKSLSPVDGSYIKFNGDGDLEVQAPFINSVSGVELSVTAGELTVDLSNKADVSSVTAVSNDLDVLNTSVNALDIRVGDLESSPAYISTVGPNLAVSAGELTVNLSDYALTTALADYALNGDLVALDGRVGTLEGANSYISSVGANLDVNAGELTVDLSGFVAESSAGEISGNDYKLTSKSVLSNSGATHSKYIYSFDISSPATINEFFILDNTSKFTQIEVRLTKLSGDSQGTIVMKKVYDYDDYAEISSSSFVEQGTCSGSEMTLYITSKSHIGFLAHKGASDSKFMAEVSVMQRDA